MWAGICFLSGQLLWPPQRHAEPGLMKPYSSCRTVSTRPGHFWTSRPGGVLSHLVCPNHKPWMTWDVHWLPSDWVTRYATTRHLKGQITWQVEDHLDSNNSRQVWQGGQHITESQSQSCPSWYFTSSWITPCFEVQSPEARIPHQQVHSHCGGVWHETLGARRQPSNSNSSYVSKDICGECTFI